MTPKRSAAMRTWSVAIIEDEPLALQRMKRLVARHRDLLVVGDATTGADAVELIERQQPDIVLIDIALPELNAFEVLNAVRVAPLPLVIFMTAFDQYAVDAFGIHAVDYVLKPVRRERFDEAIDRARQRLSAGKRGDDLLHRLDRTGLMEKRRLVLRVGDRIVFAAPAEIEWIAAVGNYVKVHHAGRNLLARQTLSSMEARLQGDGFVRIQRSVLVNAERIAELLREDKDTLTVVLASGARFRLSERYRQNLRSLFDGL